MTQTRARSHTEAFAGQYGTRLSVDLTATAKAAAERNWRQASVLAGRLRADGERLHRSVLRDALAAGLDWFTMGDLLGMHYRTGTVTAAVFTVQAAAALLLPAVGGAIGAVIGFGLGFGVATIAKPVLLAERYTPAATPPSPAYWSSP